MSSPPRLGRPSRFNQRLADTILAWCEEGLTEDQIAAHLGVSVRTIARWKGAARDFRQAVEQAKDVADDLVEASLFQRAIGWSQPKTKAFYNAKLDKVVEHRTIERFPPDVAAAIIWLKNRRPEEWRDNYRMEHTGGDGGPVQVASSVQLMIELPANGREAPMIDVTPTADSNKA